MLHLLLYLKQSNSHVVSVAQGSSAFHSLRVLSPHVHIASRREINKSTKPVNKIVDKTIGISNDVSLIRTKSSVPSRSNVVDATSTIHIVRDTSLDSMAAPPNKSAASAKNLPDSLINLSDIENVQDSTPSSTKLKVKWTSELEDALKIGVEKYKAAYSWARVAEHVGHGVTVNQCVDKWRRIKHKGTEEKPWTAEELQKLEDILPDYVIEPYWSKHVRRVTQEYIDWQSVGHKFRRPPHSCSDAWKVVCNSRKRKGRFSTEEDALIIRKKAEWGNKGRGLWRGLEKELGRPSSTISIRWKTLCKRAKTEPN